MMSFLTEETDRHFGPLDASVVIRGYGPSRVKALSIVEKIMSTALEYHDTSLKENFSGTEL